MKPFLIATALALMSIACRPEPPGAPPADLDQVAVPSPAAASLAAQPAVHSAPALMVDAATPVVPAAAPAPAAVLEPTAWVKPAAGRSGLGRPPAAAELVDYHPIPPRVDARLEAMDPRSSQAAAVVEPDQRRLPRRHLE